MRNDGMRPTFACLKMVILETVNISGSSFAVRARSIRSIRSANDSGSVPFSLHDCIYLLIWIYVRGYCRNCMAYFYIFIPLYFVQWSYSVLLPPVGQSRPATAQVCAFDGVGGSFPFYSGR